MAPAIRYDRCRVLFVCRCRDVRLQCFSPLAVSYVVFRLFLLCCACVYLSVGWSGWRLVFDCEVHHSHHRKEWRCCAGPSQRGQPVVRERSCDRRCDATQRHAGTPNYHLHAWCLFGSPSHACHLTPDTVCVCCCASPCWHRSAHLLSSAPLAPSTPFRSSYPNPLGPWRHQHLQRWPRRTWFRVWRTSTCSLVRAAPHGTCTHTAHTHMHMHAHALFNL